MGPAVRVRSEPLGPAAPRGALSPGLRFGATWVVLRPLCASGKPEAARALPASGLGRNTAGVWDSRAQRLLAGGTPEWKAPESTRDSE